MSYKACGTSWLILCSYGVRTDTMCPPHYDAMIDYSFGCVESIAGVCCGIFSLFAIGFLVTHTHTYTHHTYTYTHLYPHTHTHTHTHTHIHIHTYAHTHIHTYTLTYTRIHTYTLNGRLPLRVIEHIYAPLRVSARGPRCFRATSFLLGTMLRRLARRKRLRRRQSSEAPLSVWVGL